MRRIAGFLPILGLLAACGDSSGPEIANVIGTYSYAANIDGDIYNGLIRITSQTAGSFSGSYTESGDSYPMNGSITGSAIALTITGPGITIQHNGTWTNGNVSGTYSASIPGSSIAITGSFTMTRTSTTAAVTTPGPAMALIRALR